MSTEGFSWVNAREFAHRVRQRRRSTLELAEALLWYRHHCKDHPGSEGMSALDVAQLLDNYGLANQQEAFMELSDLNRLSSLSLDIQKGGYVTNYGQLPALDAKYRPLVAAPPRPPLTEYLIDPVEIDDRTSFRMLFSALVDQANRCYKFQFPDACALICRRLVEVLLIKAFDARGNLDKIIDSSDPDRVVGLGQIIGKAKSGNYGLRLHKDTKDLLDKVYRAGNDAAHSDFYPLKMKDVDEFASGMDKAITDLLNQAQIAFPKGQSPGP